MLHLQLSLNSLQHQYLIQLNRIFFPFNFDHLVDLGSTNFLHVGSLHFCNAVFLFNWTFMLSSRCAVSWKHPSAKNYFQPTFDWDTVMRIESRGIINIQVFIINYLMEAAVRIARHAGSWYTKSKQALDQELQKYLSLAERTVKSIQSVKAIIAPHAGYAYSGPTAGWAYQYLQMHASKHPVKRVFLLGPSHKKYINGCSLSAMAELATPLGNLKVDTETIKTLNETGQFVKLSKKDEQNQHSLEMHLPFLYKVLGDRAKIVPIIVGETNPQSLEMFGKLFAPYFKDKDTVFVISSDFCHWGEYFDFQVVEKDQPVWETIQRLDRQAMDIIQKHNLEHFQQYMKKTNNTICGEQPIKILLSTINQINKAIPVTQFVKYAQSEKIMVPGTGQSSVSYASSVTYIEEIKTE